MHAGTFRQRRTGLAPGFCRRHAEHAVGAAGARRGRAYGKLRLRLRRRSLLTRPDRLLRGERHRHRRKPDHPRRPARPLCDHADRRGTLLHLLAQRFGSTAACLRSGALAKSLENQALVYFSGITLAILEPAAREALHRRRTRRSQGGQPDRLRCKLPAAPMEIPGGCTRRDRRSAVRHGHRAADLPRRAEPLRRRLARSDGREARRGWRRRDRGQERRAAGQRLPRRQGARAWRRCMSNHRRHDRRRQFLQRQLSRRAACGLSPADATRQAHCGRSSRGPGARRAGAIRDAAGGFQPSKAC